jgi:hypothetical protein
MFDAAVATYGESNTLWDGRDAKGFTRIVGLQSFLAKQASANKLVGNTTPSPTAVSA